MAALDLHNSTTRPYKVRWVTVTENGKTYRTYADNVDGDDPFPPAVKEYRIVDGWLIHTNHDGVEGVVLGTKADLIKWMAAVDKENTDRPVVTELWDADKHGGADHVQDTLNMATKTLRRFGVAPIPMEVWVSTRPMAASAAGRNKITFVNIHKVHGDSILGVSLPWPLAVGAHEASHVGFMEHNQRGRAVVDVLKWRQAQGKPAISLYHALSGHGEGIAEAGAAYMLIPKVMKKEEPELYAACSYWFGDGPEPIELTTKTASTRMELTDPMFNYREITKNLVLLEDHLSHPYKMCMDCVRKHLITVEALAEEASAMDKTGETSEFGEELAELARRWMEEITDGANPKTISTEMRELRKRMMPLVHDPRGTVSKVAELYEKRRDFCQHAQGEICP